MQFRTGDNTMTELEQFYKNLDTIYATGSLEEVEDFLEQELRKYAGGCSACFKPMIVTICNELGTLYRGTGQFKKAEEIFGVARDNIITFLGKDNMEYATILNNIAGNKRLQGDLEGAEKMFLECADIYEKTVGKDTLLYCSLLNNIALVYQEQQKYEESEKYLLDSLAILEKRDDSKQELAITLCNLGTLYLGMKKYEEGEKYIKDSIEIYDGLPEEERVHLAAAYNSLGSLYAEKEDYENALTAFEKAKELTLHYFGRNHEYQILEKSIHMVLQRM